MEDLAAVVTMNSNILLKTIRLSDKSKFEHAHSPIWVLLSHEWGELTASCR